MVAYISASLRKFGWKLLKIKISNKNPFSTPPRPSPGGLELLWRAKHFFTRVIDHKNQLLPKKFKILAQGWFTIQSELDSLWFFYVNLVQDKTIEPVTTFIETPESACVMCISNCFESLLRLIVYKYVGCMDESWQPSTY